MAAKLRFFWRDLSDADIIDESITGALTDAADVDGTAAGFNILNYLPESALRRGLIISAFSVTGRNYYYMGNVGGVNNAGVIAPTNGLSPSEAFQIDTKVDDGVPNTGTVISVSIIDNVVGGGSAAPDADGTDDCFDSTNNFYNTTTDVAASSIYCQLRLRFN